MFYFTRHEWRCLLLFAGLLAAGSLLCLYRASDISAKPIAAENIRVLEKIYINQATAAELERLSGIGPRSAEAIIEYRTRYSYFYCCEDLAKVKGISLKQAKSLSKRLLFDVPRESI